jgi:hypothetical protein
MRQVMNRLDELARRQQDLNEQVRELDLALQAAEDEKEKNQLQDRLDRLREEQQELVQDSDELLERMNNPETRNALEESRQQIETAREQMQQSEQQLRNSQPSAALNSGSRAQENMEKTRQQLREQSSQALEKDVQRLVDQAQSIVEKQSQLEQQLQEQTGSDSSPDRRSTEPDEPTQSRQESLLRNDREFAQDEDTQQRFLEAWKEQKEDYQQLLNQIKDTVEQAEGSEPLLADQLYETYRQANQLSTEQRLDRIPLMIERGLDQPAVDEAQEVSKDLRGLRDRIEQSSKSVLGSEEESLRRALGELEKANRAIEEELAERGGADPKNGSAENPQSGQPQSGQPQSDQPQSDQPQSGQPQSGQPQSGQPQSGQASGNEPRQGGGRSFLEQLQEQVARTETQAGQLRAPLTGEDYAQWTDRLRDIEELVRDPDLRAQAARVREAARDVRIEYKRHSKEPQWDLVKKVISDPLQELQRKVQQELIRKTAKQNELVPLDRDPVPEKYRIELDRYFESLGEERSK